MRIIYYNKILQIIFHLHLIYNYCVWGHYFTTPTNTYRAYNTLSTTTLYSTPTVTYTIRLIISYSINKNNNIV